MVTMNIEQFLELSDEELAKFAIRKMKQYNAGVLDLTDSSDITDDELLIISALNQMMIERGLAVGIEGWQSFTNFVAGEMARRNGI